MFPIQTIFSVQAIEMIKNGDEGYLCYIASSEKTTKLSLEETPIVFEYLDVFYEGLPCLPPRREVNFHIDLIPDAIPISKTPYHFAPTKLVVLKK